MEPKAPKRVQDIMSEHLYVLNTSDKLNKAEKMFKDYNLRHLPVIHNRELVGMLSLTDIKRLSFGDTFGIIENTTTINDELTVNQVMKQNPNTTNPHMLLSEVAKILIKEEFHALPVVEDDKLVGIVTTTDVIEYLLAEYEVKESGDTALQQH